jgi:hypothetical protein
LFLQRHRHVASTISGGTIASNSISDIKQTNPSGWGSNGIFLSASSTASNLLVANNFIYDVASQGFNDVTATDNGYGIMVNTGGGYNIYHNSVRMTTDQVATTGITAAINVGSGITTAGTIDLRNNLLINSQTLGVRYAFYSAAANTVFSNINYNDYTSTGTNIGNIGATVRPNLAALQAGTLQDAQSMSSDPLFASLTNLHIAGLSPAKGQGIAIGAVTTDFDGQTRSTGVSPNGPEIGADELTFTTISVPNVSFSPSNPAPKFVISNIGTSSATVAYTTQDGTAVGGAVCGAGVDYVSVSGGPIVINAGTSIDVNITLCADPDPAETFSLQVTNSSASFTGTNTISSTMTILGPTAASASVRGRLISAFGRNLANAGVAITNTSTGETKYTRSNQLGFFNFLDLQTGSVYVVSVQSKRFIFANHTFTLNEDLTDLVLTAQANDSKQ